MSFLARLFGEKKSKTAETAKNRLSLLIAHERTGGTPAADFLPALQRELIEVISKYVAVNPDDIKVQLDKQDNMDVLEVNIILPEQPRLARFVCPALLCKSTARVMKSVTIADLKSAGASLTGSSPVPGTIRGLLLE